MKILAIDTATEQCSVAITTETTHWMHVVPTARSHADMILPMIDALLTESNLTLDQLDGLAFGRGPGSFTGVRIAVSVIQGLALARQLAVAAVSNLAAVAQQIVNTQSLPTGANILVCMDARMQEVYWAQYQVGNNGLVSLIGQENVGSPNAVNAEGSTLAWGVGTGWRAYPQLRDNYAALAVDDSVLPRASDIAQIARAEFKAGRTTNAANAQPVYLRDQVVFAARTP